MNVPTRQSNFTKSIPDAKGYYQLKYEIEPRGSKTGVFSADETEHQRKKFAAANKKGELSYKKDLDKMNREK